VIRYAKDPPDLLVVSVFGYRNSRKNGQFGYIRILLSRRHSSTDSKKGQVHGENEFSIDSSEMPLDATLADVLDQVRTRFRGNLIRHW